MGLKIERKGDVRFAKAIMTRVADIPGGVTIQTSVLGGAAILEGTPVGPVANGMYGVAKTAKVVTAAAIDAVAYEVAKGHHFKIGDFFGTAACNGKAITAIDKTTSAVVDTITLATTLGAVVAAGTVAYQTGDGNKVITVTPTAIAGSSYDVEVTNNLFVDAWLVAVVNSLTTPPVDAGIKTALKGVFYV